MGEGQSDGDEHHYRPHDIKSTDFAYNDAGTDDYTLPAGSLAFTAGSAVGPNVGLKEDVSYDVNIGADQGDHSAGAFGGIIIVSLDGDFYLPGRWF